MQRDNGAKRGIAKLYGYGDCHNENNSIAVSSSRHWQTQGFLESLFELMGVDLSVPDHSTLSRRRGKLQVELPIIETGFAYHVGVDSRGVIVGEIEQVSADGAYDQRSCYSLTKAR